MDVIRCSIGIQFSDMAWPRNSFQRTIFVMQLFGDMSDTVKCLDTPTINSAFHVRTTMLRKEYNRGPVVLKSCLECNPGAEVQIQLRTQSSQSHSIIAGATILIVT